MTISPSARRVLALERRLAPVPPVPPKVNCDFEELLMLTTPAELDELERIYRVAAMLGLDGPQGADRERALEIIERAERRRQAGEPPA